MHLMSHWTVNYEPTSRARARHDYLHDHFLSHRRCLCVLSIQQTFLLFILFAISSCFALLFWLFSLFSPTETDENRKLLAFCVTSKSTGPSSGHREKVSDSSRDAKTLFRPVLRKKFNDFVAICWRDSTRGASFAR